MSKDIEGRWALVTGASSGLGVHFSHELARRRANVVLVARREERLVKLAEELRTVHHVEVDVVAMDLGLVESPIALHREMNDRGRQIDILVNNAGFGLYGPDRSIPWERAQALIQLDIQTLVHLTKLYVEDMVSRGWGRILQVASVGAYQPCPHYAVYAAAKAFVASYSEALNHELKGTGVSCTVISPGVTKTEFFDSAGQQGDLTAYQRVFMMTPEAVARVGINAMLRRRSGVVPGLMNSLNAWVVRVIPRRMATSFAGMAANPERPTTHERE